MRKLSPSDILQLSVAERLELVEDIWNSIADAPDSLELTEEDRRLIDERLEAYQRDPHAGSPWKDVYARLASHKK